MDLSGKVALVTGATSGIGRETAVQLTKAGAKVVLAGRRNDLGDAAVQEIVAAGGEAVFVATDVTQEDQVRRLVNRAIDDFGRLDVAVNNAGVELIKLLSEFTVDDYRRVFDVNVLGVFLSLKYEIPAMLQSGGDRKSVV